MEETKIQGDFLEDKLDENSDRDRIYKELKSFEKEELKKVFLKLKDEFKRNNFNENNLNLILNIELVSSIIEEENTRAVLKKKNDR